MDINQFFKTHKKAERAAVALAAGTTLDYLNLCKYNKRRMGAEIAIWLEYVTDGEMTAAELRPDLPWPNRTPSETQFSAANRKNRRPPKPRNEQAADRDNDPPLMPAHNRESHHASDAKTPIRQ